MRVRSTEQERQSLCELRYQFARTNFNTMTLPTFSECFDKAKAGTATTLEKFIANFEPERDADAEVFREQLSELIEESYEPDGLLVKEDVTPLPPMAGCNLRFFWNPATNTYEPRK